ncbi:MAG: D-alanine--D-alanine ligase [Proteobacteria bacterium]|nr:D-alanine--D-alanine ligase [Pseudomonadota bacterium]MBU1714475.1 D-alanine--D-alanine ligase [Pseudomonadota bacterium]
MQIGVIHNQPIPKGEPNWESSIDVMVQVEAISRALTELGHVPIAIPFTRDLASFINQLQQADVEAAFNLCESVDEDPRLIGHPAAVLELLGLPFTGSSSMALAVSTDKLLNKRIMANAGIRTSAFFAYEGGEVPRPLNLTFPLIMKPRWQDASIGIDQESMILNSKGMLKTLSDFYRRFGPLLVEEYVEGREFNVSLLGDPLPRVMPLAEIDFSGFPSDLFRIVGYKAKWDEESAEYKTTGRVFPDDLPRDLSRSIRRVAKDCFQLFGLRDYGRVDMRIDFRGRIYVLEVNANPCLSPDAGFTAAVLKADLSYKGMVGELVNQVNRRIR